MTGTILGCDIMAEDLHSNGGGFSCRIQGQTLYTSAEGGHLVYSILPAFALGLELGMDPTEIASGVAGFSPLPGRGNIIETPLYRIIDHSYNANPNSMKAALDNLLCQRGRHVAILGDMYELGADSAVLHKSVCAYLAGRPVDLMLCVGKLGKAFFDGALRYRAAKDAYYFPTVEEALTALPSLLQKGDCILVKASHSLHLEQIVETLEKAT